jgi:hypothetical protein
MHIYSGISSLAVTIFRLKTLRIAKPSNTFYFLLRYTASFTCFSTQADSLPNPNSILDATIKATYTMSLNSAKDRYSTAMQEVFSKTTT